MLFRSGPGAVQLAIVVKIVNPHFEALLDEVLASGKEAVGAGFYARALKQQRYYTADEHDYGAALEARMGLFAHEVDEPDEGRASIDTSRPTVEKALQKLGYITTDYRAAVKAFQADHPPLAVDGIVGPRTSAALTTALLGAGVAARAKRPSAGATWPWSC